MKQELPKINHQTVVFTKHARERMDLRRINEDMIIQIMRKPNAMHNLEDGKIKFIGKAMGAKVHAIGKPIPEENKWLVISLWVRGEEDSGNFVNRGTHRRKSPDSFSKISATMFFLLIFFVVMMYYFSDRF